MINIKFDESFTSRLFFFLAFVSIFFSMTEGAFASGSGDVIGSQLCTLITTLKGSTAKAIATIAIISTAGMFMMGNMKWPQVAMISSGIIIIFSAPGIVNMISTGNGNGCAS